MSAAALRTIALLSIYNYDGKVGSRWIWATSTVTWCEQPIIFTLLLRPRQSHRAQSLLLPQQPQDHGIRQIIFRGKRLTRDISMGDMSGPFYWSAQSNLLNAKCMLFSACWPAHLPQLHKKSPRPLLCSDCNGRHDYAKENAKITNNLEAPRLTFHAMNYKRVGWNLRDCILRSTNAGGTYGIFWCVAWRRCHERSGSDRFVEIY